MSDDFYVLDTDLKTLAIIDSYISMIWTDRFNEFGDFQLIVPETKANVSLYTKDRLLYSSDTDSLMIIEDYVMEEDEEKGRTITITGRSYESMLNRRILWNDIVFEGNIQDLIERMLKENVIEPSDSSRKIPNIVFDRVDDSVVNSKSVTETLAVGSFVGDNANSVCQTADIGWKLRNRTSGGELDPIYHFSLYSGVDRSADQNVVGRIVLSSDTNTLSSSTYTESNSDYKNFILTRTTRRENNDSERVIESYAFPSGNVPSGKDRYESYISASVVGEDLSDDDIRKQLQNQANSELNKKQKISAFDCSVNLSRFYRYGKDYNIGDIISVKTPFGLIFKARVSEFVRSYTDSDSNQYPTLSVIS